jgi:hypothetical protein
LSTCAIGMISMGPLDGAKKQPFVTRETSA